MEPIVSADTGALTPIDKQRLVYWSWAYIARQALGVDRATSERLAFARWMCQQGHLNEGVE